jgi:hypothetical protein
MIRTDAPLFPGLIRVEYKSNTYQASYRSPSGRIVRASCTAGSQRAAEALVARYWPPTATVVEVEQQTPDRWGRSYWRVLE